MKRSRKTKNQEHVSSGVGVDSQGQSERGLKKMMAESQRVLRGIERARQRGDKDELHNLQNKLKDVQGRLRTALAAPDEQREKQADKNETTTRSVKIISENGEERWVLERDMHFGLIKVGFVRGMTFTVNREKNVMVCDDTGQSFTNIKDLDIAIRIGVARPLDEETATIVEEQRERKQKIVEEALHKQRDNDNELRSRIVSSDQDILAPIPVPSAKKKEATSAPVRQLKTPTNIVSLIKPRHRQAQNIIVSDGVQQSTKVGDSVILGTKKNQFWDSKNSGQRSADIRKVVGNTSVERDESGRLVVRGMGVVRDDSRVGSGPSLNEGSVVSLTPEERRERRSQAKERAAERKSEVKEKRKKSGVDVADPVVMTADVDETTQLIEEKTTSSQERKTDGKIGQLLRRRF